MKNKIKAIIKTTRHDLIKVRLDYRTFITVTNMSALEVWRKRYPDAKVITS